MILQDFRLLSIGENGEVVDVSFAETLQTVQPDIAISQVVNTANIGEPWRIFLCSANHSDSGLHCILPESYQHFPGISCYEMQ